MVDDVNANIRVNIETAQAAAQLTALENRISEFNRRVIQSNSQAVAAQRQSMAMLQQRVGDIGKFSTQITNLETSVGSFSKALDKGKLSFGEYFRYGLASTKTFGKAFGKELSLIEATAEDRVKKLSTRFVALGDSANGMQKALAIRPEVLPSNFTTDLALAAQKQQIFNQLLRQGSTHLLNWGKNTQWAGRQLMVGFTIPLSIFGGIAAKTFMQLEEQAIAFRKVYGDIFTTDQEVEQNLEAVRGLTTEFTKYGIAAEETLALANIAAQAGQRGNDLLAATTEATRLGVLGQMESQEAMMTTITLQNAFKLSNEELTNSINFLNVVENQSVLSLQDVAGAIPRVAPVISALGGDVKDLSVMLVAMREGGVTAAEAANALKTSLSRLISPTAGAVSMAEKFGISLNDIVETNQGDILGSVMELAEAMEGLSGLESQRLLSEIFGKRQYARIGALFENITNDASQAQRVLELTGMSVEELAETTERELGAVEDNISTRFVGALERAKAAIAPIGETFLTLVTPIIEGVTRMLEAFNNMPKGVKMAVTAVVAVLGGIAPVFLMGIGLIANGIANLTKGFLSVRTMYQKVVSRLSGHNTLLTQSYGYMSSAELEAAAAADALEGKMLGLTDVVLMQEQAVSQLAQAYRSVASSMESAAMSNPQGFLTSPRMRRMATGGFVGGRGNKDSEPALLMPGEFVVTKEAAEQYAPILVAMNQGKLQGYAEGTPSSRISSRRFVPEPTSAADIQSNRAMYEFGHAAGFAANELKSTVTSLSQSADEIRALGANASEADRALLQLLDTVLNTEKTFVRFEEAADGSWQATEVATKSLKDLSVAAESSASLGQFAGGKITSGTRNEALKQIGVDEPISFADLRLAAEAAEQKLLAVANGAAEVQLPFQYALQGVIDEYHSLEGNLQAQSQYLLDNAQSMVRDALMTNQKMSAEQALAMSLEKRQAIEADLIRTGAMLEGELVDSVRAQQVVEAHLLDYAQAIALSENAQVARRAAMSQSSASGVGKIGQPKIEGTRTKIFATPATRTSVAQSLQEEGIEIGNEIGRLFVPALGDGVSQGMDVSSPPPWSLQLGEWIAIGIQEGAEQQSQRFKAAYPSLPYSPGGSVEGQLGSTQSQQIMANLEEMGLVVKKDSDAIEQHTVSVRDDALAEEMNSNSTRENTVETEKNSAAVKENSREQKRGLGGFRGMLYALDGVALAMSFLPGPIGEIANKAFIASAALTAFDSILRVEIIKKALGMFKKALVGAAAQAGVQTAARGVGTAVSTGADVALTASLLRGGKAGKTAGFFTKLLGPLGKAVALFTRLLPALGRLALALTRFVGVVVNGIPAFGQVISAVILLATTLAAFGFAYKHAGNQITDLGNAAKITGDELKNLADKFGFTQRTTGFENVSTVLGRSEEARTVAQEARAYVAEDSGMQERATRIGAASDAGAEAALRSFFLDLLAQGAPRDVAVGIVEAVAEEAGKQQVFVPIQADIRAAIDDEGKIKEMGQFIEQNLRPSLDNLEGSFASLSKQGFNQMIDQGAVDDAKRWMAAVDMLPEFAKEAIVPQYKMKKAILETASSLNLVQTNTQTAMNFLSAEFANGEIGLKKFNSGMQEIEDQLASLPANQGLEVMKQQMVELYPQSESTIRSITDAGIAFDILSLQAQGVNMGKFIQEMQAAGFTADETRAKLEALAAAQARLTSAQTRIAKIEAKLEAEKNKPTKQPGDDGGGGGGSKDPFAAAEDELRDEQAEITIKEIKIDRTAEDRFRKNLTDRFGAETIAVGDIEISLDNMEDARYATEMIGEQIEDIERGPMKAWQDEIDALNDEIKVYQDQLDLINRDIELQEQAIAGIEREYKPILDNLEDQRKAQEDILQGLEDEIEAQVRPIDNRIASLEREMRIAEQAAKPRLDALDEEEALLDQQNEALDEQLDYLDKQEDALNKVAKQNDYIARQQKNRIDLSRALSEGDIYAAAQAAEQIRQDAAEKASEDQKEAFDQQRDRIKDEKDQIDEKKQALEDERDLIQEQLDAIQEQIDAEEHRKFLIEDSYRLRLQDAEDALKNTDREIDRVNELKDARIAPYQAIIDNYAPKIETLNNNIYDKEQDIKKIQDDKLLPLQSQIDKLTEQRDLIDDIVDDTQRSIDRDKAHLTERKKFLDQELQILAARREIADLSSGGGGGGAGGDVELQDPDKIKKLEEELARLRAEEKAAQEEISSMSGPAEIQDQAWWEGIVGFAIAAWSTFAGWFQENVIAPITAAWNTVATWVDTNVIQPIKNAWNTVSSEVAAVVETIAALLVAIWQIFNENVITPIKNAWNAWYDENVAPKLQAIQDWWEKVRAAFVLKFNEIKTFFTTWWNANIQPKLDKIAEWWEKVRSNFEEKFNAMKSFFTTWWETSIQPKIDAIVEVWETVRAAFVEKFEAIGEWWDEWKRLIFDAKVDAMKSSLATLFNYKTWYNWMVDAVGGIMRAWNKLRLELSVPDNFVTQALGIANKSITLDTPDLSPPQKINTGGFVLGNGARDSVPAMLSPGEFVVRKAMVDKYGGAMLKSINQGSFNMPTYDIPNGQMETTVNSATMTSINAPVYNTYDMKFNITGANANADEIAHKVMTKIRNIDSASIRGINGY